MSGEEIRLGFFSGGLNTLADPTAIGDTELSWVENFEQGSDGSLVNRPPIVKIDNGTPGSSTLPGGADMRLTIIGEYAAPGARPQIVASNGQDKTYIYTGGGWQEIAATNMSAAVQYRDDLWLVSMTATGGKWSPASGFTADANMPKGNSIVAFKDRLWIGPGKSATVNGTRLYMSVIVSGAVSWPVAPAFVNVGAGDGQNIVDVFVYNGDLIVFKSRSTYRFSFTADPALGAIQSISSKIGAFDIHCVTEWQNQLFVLFDNKVFEFSNYLYEQLNDKVPLRASRPSTAVTSPLNISAWADRLIVNYYDSSYVYSIKNRTWSIWRTSRQDGGGVYWSRFWPITGYGARIDQPAAYFTNNILGAPGMYSITDAVLSGVSEKMDCFFITKNYDYDSAAKWKRLFWTGIDAISNTEVYIESRPISSARRMTWGELKKKTWGAIKEDKLVWGRLAGDDPDIMEVIPVGGAAFGRRLLKTTRSLRFRQIAFKVGGTTSGDTETSPLRIFTLTTFVKDKQVVAKRVQ